MKGYDRAVTNLLAYSGVIPEEIPGKKLNSDDAMERPTPATHDGDQPSNSQSAIDDNLTESSKKCDGSYKDLLEKYERLGRQHARAILELSQCKNNYRLRFGAEQGTTNLLRLIDD